MKIFVTGGAGFIGSHIVDAVLSDGHEVVVIDNLSSGKKSNLAENVRLMEADIEDFERMRNIFEVERPEAVFHLAAQIDVRKSVSDPLSDARTNILASINLITLAHEFSVSRFVFSSTGGAIYGDTGMRPTSEAHSEWPLSPYGIAKLAVDKYLHYYREVHGLNTVSLRYGNVYGPRQNPHGEAGVVSIFLDRMLSGTQPTINGDGTQTRDYVFVEDVARANLLALRHPEATGVFNVGTGIETDVNTLFHELNTCFGGAFKESHGPAKPGEQKASCLDASRIHSELGWTAEVPFADGIRRTYEWFREHDQM
jgi:UDP-glucose 4-epimerase